MPTLEQLGFAEPFESAFHALQDPALSPARVSAAHRGAYAILSEHGPQPAAVSGRLRHAARDPADLPAVGDWVAVRHLGELDQTAVIDGVLPRRTALCRSRPAGSSEAQLIATNLDTVFVVMALNQDFNPRRLERYLALIWQSGAQPVVLLSKADLSADPEAQRAAAVAVAPGAPVEVVSCVSGDGLSSLDAYLGPGRTIALVGSSGAGKSTLANALLAGEFIATGEIREADGRGRHTTTRRELFMLPSHALLIDTPGMREVGLWDAGDGLKTTFDDLEAFTQACRFRDCSHADEPGCGVLSALEAGELSADRYASYMKLQRELAYVDRQRDERSRREHHARMVREFKARTRSLRHLYKRK